ncbi:hydrogenase nickel incorporation protein HypB [Tindallia californiensis]|uniref:Hydrogenase nickel incorporation protein HypB n=1 Tax=Tindallia californiensis TaxID=159292 RepID=A0A1H3QRV0_9FIRM|nr:hydrogenase nickel incorporation protein HypB [Tindallia californiensis]SDZ15728.1 Hydrogenase nickel incorporation protein HypB [Tindallia californiensis]
MEAFKVIEIKKSVYKDNDERASLLRKDLEKQEIFLLNLMSSPGSGKTTTVLGTIEELKAKTRMGVMEADIDSDVDAMSVATTNTKVIQLHTGGMCHIDAEMTKEGLRQLGTEDLDFVILENIGNLICTAGYDVGAAKNVMILSVPEGDDKPLKYPVMFEKVDCILVNKIDAMAFFDFNMEKLKERVATLNPDATIIPISSKTGEGMDAWIGWLLSAMEQWKKHIHSQSE